MDAAPLLAEVARTLDEVKLDAVLIGNAAAALQGAPVTTIPVAFVPRSSVRTIQSPICIELLAMRMACKHGIRSYEAIRDRASTVEFAGAALRVASLVDIIKSKRAAGRPRDLAVLEVLEMALEESRQPARPPRSRRAGKSP